MSRRSLENSIRDIMAKSHQPAAQAISEEVVMIAEDDYKVGDKVKCLDSGMTGTVVKLDKPETGKYYTVKREDGKTIKYAPNELKAVGAMKEEAEDLIDVDDELWEQFVSELNEEGIQLDELSWDDVKNRYTKFYGGLGDNIKNKASDAASAAGDAIAKTVGPKTVRQVKWLGKAAGSAADAAGDAISKGASAVGDLANRGFDKLKTYVNKPRPAAPTKPEPSEPSKANSMQDLEKKKKFAGAKPDWTGPGKGVASKTNAYAKPDWQGPGRGVAKEEVELDELSKETLASYKKKAGEDASKADKEGDFKRGNKRFSGIVKATKKEFDKATNEEKDEEGTERELVTTRRADAGMMKTRTADGKYIWKKKPRREVKVESVQFNEEDLPMDKLTMLVRSGLVDNLAQLRVILKKIESEKVLTPAERSVVVNTFGKLLRMVTSDPMMFRQARKMAKEDVSMYAFDPSDSGGAEEVRMALRQLHFIEYAAQEIMDYVEMAGDLDEWFQNKLNTTFSMIRGLHSYIEGDKRLKGWDQEDDDEDEEEMGELPEVSASTLKSYKDKAGKEIKDLAPHAKSGEYKDIAKKLLDKRRKGFVKAGARLAGAKPQKEEFELEEAKATMCSRCGTKHVRPEEGGTCPALSKAENEARRKKANEEVNEKTSTPAELKKREEIAKAIERENPNMPMDKKMAIATAQAKKVAEANEDKPPFDGPYKDRERDVKDKSGAVHTPMSRAKDLAQKAMKKAAKQRNESLDRILERAMKKKS